MEFLYSSDSKDDSEVQAVRVTNGGSVSQCVRLRIQGVPVFGIIDSRADITIMGGELFKKIAATARLKKRDFQAPDKVPRTYDQQPFTLDGCMDLNVTIGDNTMKTPVYLKWMPMTNCFSQKVCADSWASSPTTRGTDMERWLETATK